mgnify:CR=1 FL=1
MFGKLVVLSSAKQIHVTINTSKMLYISYLFIFSFLFCRSLNDTDMPELVVSFVFQIYLMVGFSATMTALLVDV